MCGKTIISLLTGMLAWTACEVVDTDPDKEIKVQLSLEEVARTFSESGFGLAQAGEVYDAVNSSSENGYDEEYLMRDLFDNPGYGVGDSMLKTESKSDGNGYEKPLRELLRESLEARASRSSVAVGVRQRETVDVDAWLDALESSDYQIYWPYSEDWDGCTLPVVTFDPGNGSEVNVGYEVKIADDGSRSIAEVIVDEEMAMARPVWVVNRNDDGNLMTPQMRDRLDPGWGGGGGEIIVRPAQASPSAVESTQRHRMLVLRSVTMLRNYDSWFAGASECSFKVGSADGFRAATEAELKLYQPTITDFDLVLRRRQKGDEVVVNTVLVSDWTDQIENCVLLINEYDGGTQTSWKCSIVAKYNSKSFGLDVDIPYHQKDDIVWRGQLSRSYMERNSGRTGHFGEMDLVFEMVEY